MELYQLTISEASRLLNNREISPKELLETCLLRIDAVEDSVKAFVTVNKEALKHIEEVTETHKGALWGVPLAIKDNMCTKGVRTTCSSKILENFIPPYESTATGKLMREGYVLLGKTNLDEFAMGSSTENSGFFPTRNPWAFERVPGGSSGGSAAAVAADECIAALGSDTGGSIRQPASFCGVVGMKPTYGRVSRYGLVAFASSLDQIGPVTKDVRDTALLLDIICGHDSRDATSADLDVPDFSSVLGKEIKGLKIGIPREYFIEGIDTEVAEHVRNAIKIIESLGGEIIDISLPHTGYAVASYYLIATSEASSNLARYDGVKFGLREQGTDLLDMYRKTRSAGFGQEVKRRIMLGTFALSSGYYDAYYKKAQQVRTLIRQDFRKAFETVDVIATPTCPTTAFKIGEMISDPLQMYLSDILTIPVNLAGLPAISVPCGFSTDEMPVGLQIIGNHFDEENVLKAAYAYEQSTAWHLRRPSP